jgi:SAM-dependent methyltransferase
VLDAACGVGYGTLMMAAAGARTAVGLDIAEDVIEAANHSAPPDVSFVAGDVGSMPFDDDSFDLVTCFETIEHVDEAEVALAEIARVLAPGGLALVSSPNPDAYVPGNPHHVREYRAAELQRLLSRHFAHTGVRRQFDWVTSAIIGDDGQNQDGLTLVPDLEASSVIEQQPGTEPYAIVVAANQPLPPLRARLVATGLAEPRRWLEHHEEQQRVLSDQWRQWREAEARLHEVLVQADRRVAVVEDDNRKLRERADRAGRVLTEMRRSPSWRITAPLRALKRLLR